MPRSMMLLTVLLVAFAVVPTTSQTWTSSSSKTATNSLSSRIHGYVSRTTDRRLAVAAEAVRFLQVSATFAPGGAVTSTPGATSAPGGAATSATGGAVTSTPGATSAPGGTSTSVTGGTVTSAPGSTVTLSPGGAATSAPGGVATSAPSDAATPAPDETICRDATAVNFDDKFSQAVYGSAYQGTCTCVEGDNTDDLTEVFKAPLNPVTDTPEEIDEWTKNVNDAIARNLIGYDFSCKSGCATCYENKTFCGYLTYSERSSVRGRPSNFTLEEILGGFEGVDPSRLLSDTTFKLEYYISYESGETGDVRLTFDVAAAISPTDDMIPNCTILYNDMPCNSCKSTVESDDDIGICYVADCTNVVPDASLDSCAKTGFVGPFRFLSTLAALQNSTVTMGTCQASPSDGNTTANGGGTSTSSGVTEKVGYWSQMMVAVVMAIGLLY